MASGSDRWANRLCVCAASLTCGILFVGGVSVTHSWGSKGRAEVFRGELEAVGSTKEEYAWAGLGWPGAMPLGNAGVLNSLEAQVFEAHIEP